jgi:three-Cys-motif partner protein
VLDGFAGPGEYANGEPGSPIIAIETYLSHSYAGIRAHEVVFLFIEQDPARRKHLQQLLEERKQKQTFPPQASYQVFQGNFDETMTELLNSLEGQHLQLAPTFAFIDPFGYSHTPMSIIARLMRHPNCEVLITFMYEEINRFLTADYTNKERQYDALFGTQEWRRIASQTLDSTERRRQLHDLYHDQLSSVGGARYVRSFRMRNKKNATDYFLFFGTNNLKGLDKMKEAMWTVDPTGAYDFSDFTNPDQPVLFTLQPDYELLKRMLINRFRGTTVSIQELEDYILAETPFRKTGYKTEVLKPMEKAKPPQIHVLGMVQSQGERM